jgi:hypothetical protein
MILQKTGGVAGEDGQDLETGSEDAGSNDENSGRTENERG